MSDYLEVTDRKATIGFIVGILASKMKNQQITARTINYYLERLKQRHLEDDEEILLEGLETLALIINQTFGTNREKMRKRGTERSGVAFE